MPQKIHRGIKAMMDEANAEIETLSAADAIKAAESGDVVIVDIRDPREIERDGKIPGAFSCTRGTGTVVADLESIFGGGLRREQVRLPR